MKEGLTIIKVGDRTLGSPVLGQVAGLSREGFPLVFVHGGGDRINQALEKQNIKPVKIEGKRVTDAATLRIVISTLDQIGDELSKEIENLGLPTRRFGSSSGLLEAQTYDPRLGLVGAVNHVNTDLLLDALKANRLPVVTPIGVGINNPDQKLNINADDAAASIAVATNARLVLITDVAGVMDGDGKLLEQITASKYQELRKQDVITSGMIAKLDAAFTASKEGIEVFISNDANLMTAFQGTFLGSKILPF